MTSPFRTALSRIYAYHVSSTFLTRNGCAHSTIPSLFINRFAFTNFKVLSHGGGFIHVDEELKTLRGFRVQDRWSASVIFSEATWADLSLWARDNNHPILPWHRVRGVRERWPSVLRKCSWQRYSRVSANNCYKDRSTVTQVRCSPCKRPNLKDFFQSQKTNSKVCWAQRWRISLSVGMSPYFWEEFAGSFQNLIFDFWYI